MNGGLEGNLGASVFLAPLRDPLLSLAHLPLHELCPFVHERVYLEVMVMRFAQMFVALLVAVGASLPFTVGARGVDDSDIPGTPLPAASVSSSVGGPTVDRVYAVEVKQGSVFIATLTGTPGSELGLYLFNPSATSVQTSVPIASSAKPGGTQGISVTLRVAGTYYLNVNGRNLDRAYGFTLNTVVRQDTTAPQITLADPVNPSRSESVCVRVAATDGLSGVTEAALALPGDAVADAVWRRYGGSGRFCASLSLAEGQREVVLRVRNGAGLITSTGRLSVRIDDTAPQLVSSAPTSGLLTSPRAPVTWTFNEPVRLVDPTATSVYAFDQSNQSITGSVSLSNSGLRLTWTPSGPIPVGSVVLVSVAPVRDLAGNVQEYVPTLVMERKRPTALALSVISRSATSVQLRLGISANLSGGVLLLERREEGVWVQLRELTPSSAVSRIRVNTEGAERIRVRWEGDDTRAPGVSNVIRVTP